MKEGLFDDELVVATNFLLIFFMITWTLFIAWYIYLVAINMYPDSILLPLTPSVLFRNYLSSVLLQEIFLTWDQDDVSMRTKVFFFFVIALSTVDLPYFHEICV